MLAVWILFIGVMCKVSCEVSTLPSATGPLVSNISVHPFLDDNGYVRLNITWEEVLCNAESVFISFSHGEECNPISDVENYALENHFVIRPSMELKHPADDIIFGCTYNITFEDKTGACRSQSFMYNVPECVEKKCQCGKFTDSPNKLTGITQVSKDMFRIAWNSSTGENMTAHYIFYQRKDVNDSTKSHIPEKKFQYKNNAVEVPMPDLKDDVVYTINVGFIDEFNECLYGTTLDYMKSSNSLVFLVATGGVVLVVIVLMLYKISLCSPRVRTKLERYFYFPKSYESYRSQELAVPLSQSKLREEINAQYTPLEFVLKVHKYDQYEFPRNKIILGSVLGEGEFGKVCRGDAYELVGKTGFTRVAIKQLKDGASEDETSDFKAEIDILKKIGSHENIVKLLGCVTMEQPYWMIMELVTGGSLKDYLIHLRKKWSERNTSRIFFPDDMDDKWFKNSTQKLFDGRINYTTCVFDNSDGSYIVPTTPKSADSSVFLKSGQILEKKQYLASKQPPTPSSTISSGVPSTAETELTTLDLETPTPLTAEIHRLPEPVLDHTELQQFAFQIANGMRHLEKLSVTHRDLAARNILITSDKVLKISDFGMSRKGLYVNRKSKKMPLRWMAIESIESLKWNNKTDVWSFGVVLWEIGTLGAFPYERTHDMVLLPELKEGKRLERPKICTDELYALMLRCWSEEPDKRPTFSDLVEQLDVKKRKVYVDFDQISPKYVFPPIKTVEVEDDELKIV